MMMINSDSRRAQRRRINWITCVFMLIFHVCAVAALFMFSWQALAVSVGLWWISGSLGIGVGYHRLLTHRGFRVPKAVEYFLVLCGTLALEAGPIAWVATHRIHHSHTDRKGDPHTPREGRFWAHMGWILVGTAQRHSDATMLKYAPDLVKDPGHRLIEQFYWVPLVLTGLALLALGGWSMLMWAIFLRVTVGLHATWMVNSVTHLWGHRRFATTEDSTNNWIVALLTFGEGWHNNHHAFPRAARHGLAWYEIDTNWWSIRAMQMLGLATGVKLVDLSGKPLRARTGAGDADSLSKAA